MKSLYKIPVNLDRSKLDHEIVIKAFEMKAKPLAIKVLLYWIALAFAILYLLTQSWLANASWLLLAPLGVWMIVTGVVMGKRGRTGEFNFVKARAAMVYFSRGHRKVLTRVSSKPYGFLTIVGIRNIHQRGMIEFINGDVGQVYAVVGSASKLLFDSDREQIMRRVAAFYQKIDPEVTWHQITTKEPQRVFQQLAATARRNVELVHRDPGLDELLAEQARVLTDQVGGQFDSLHQYIMVRASDFTKLKHAHRVLASEYQFSSLFLRGCELLDRDATLEVLAPIYSTRGADRSQL